MIGHIWCNIIIITGRFLQMKTTIILTLYFKISCSFVTHLWATHYTWYFVACYELSLDMWLMQGVGCRDQRSASAFLSNSLRPSLCLASMYLLLCPALLVFVHLACLVAWLPCLPCRTQCNIISIIECLWFVVTWNELSHPRAINLHASKSSACPRAQHCPVNGPSSWLQF
jgi:hypothetical protein